MSLQENGVFIELLIGCSQHEMLTCIRTSLAINPRMTVKKIINERGKLPE